MILHASVSFEHAWCRIGPWIQILLFLFLSWTMKTSLRSSIDFSYKGAYNIIQLVIYCDIYFFNLWKSWSLIWMFDYDSKAQSSLIFSSSSSSAAPSWPWSTWILFSLLWLVLWARTCRTPPNGASTALLLHSWSRFLHQTTLAALEVSVHKGRRHSNHLYIKQ